MSRCAGYRPKLQADGEPGDPAARACAGAKDACAAWSSRVLGRAAAALPPRVPEDTRGATGACDWLQQPLQTLPVLRHRPRRCWSRPPTSTVPAAETPDGLPNILNLTGSHMSRHSHHLCLACPTKSRLYPSTATAEELMARIVLGLGLAEGSSLLRDCGSIGGALSRHHPTTEQQAAFPRFS